jgi:hypothetical protein
MRHRRPSSKLKKVDRTSSQPNYWRAAVQRLDTASLLLKLNDPARNLDAIYLAGYTVECGLKALILNRTSRSKQAGTFQELSSGAKSHNFEYLELMLRLRGCPLPLQCKESLKRVVGIWSTELRYASRIESSRSAKDFLDNVRTIHSWVERSLSDGGN